MIVSCSPVRMNTTMTSVLNHTDLHAGEALQTLRSAARHCSNQQNFKFQLTHQSFNDTKYVFYIRITLQLGNLLFLSFIFNLHRGKVYKMMHKMMIQFDGLIQQQHIYVPQFNILLTHINLPVVFRSNNPILILTLGTQDPLSCSYYVPYKSGGHRNDSGSTITKPSVYFSLSVNIIMKSWNKCDI